MLPGDETVNLAACYRNNRFLPPERAGCWQVRARTRRRYPGAHCSGTRIDDTGIAQLLGTGFDFARKST